MTSDLLPTSPGPPKAVSRANAYHVLARALAPPGEWEADLPVALEDHFGTLPDPLPDLATDAAREVASALEDRDRVGAAHARLFLGPFEILASPYASTYLAPEGRLMGEVSLDAARAYAEAGLGPGSRPREVPDHVCLELEFMYCLAFEEATTADPIWAERQGRFWSDHLGRWLPDFAEAMSRANVDPLYQALAALLAAYASSEDRLLG